MRSEVVLILSFLFVCVSGTRWWRQDNNIMDVSDFSVYYNMKTNQTIRDMQPRPWYKPGWLLRLPFTGGPCNCKGLSCNCCTGIRIQSIGFDRQVCTNLKFEPSDALLDMEVTMNGEKVFGRMFSAKNPPPFCILVPVPYLPPGLVDMCIRIFDISIMDQHLHMCMDWDTRIDMAPVVVLHFDCMNMGLDGVSLVKPGGNTNSSDADATSIEPTQVNGDVYDPVTETVKMKEYPFKYFNKYI